MYDAKLQRALELIGKRWTGAILYALLENGPSRFNVLLNGIPGISDRVLTQRLRELVDEGLVERSIVRLDYSDKFSPVRIRYDLTDRGRRLEVAFSQIASWARSA